MLDFNSSRYTEKILENLMEQKEAIIFQQLKNLIVDGVLQIEQTEAVLVQDPMSQTLKLQQAVRLTFNAEAVIENYRKKVTRLSEKLIAIVKILKDN